MNKPLVILGTLLLMFFLGVQTPQFAQDTSTTTRLTQFDQERIRVAIGLVRTINTAELVERTTYGSFASWQILLARQQGKFNEWLSHFYSQDPNVHFAPPQKYCLGGVCAYSYSQMA